MTYDAYQQLPGVRWSLLKRMGDSPAHYQHALHNPTAETDTLRFGRLVHSLTLDPVSVATDYAVWTGKVRRGAAWDAFSQANASKTIVRPKDFQLAQDLAVAVRSHPVAKRYLQGALHEHPVQWTDASTGIACKALLDWYHPKSTTLIDLKTTVSTDARLFASAVARYGYHGQLAHYIQGAQATGLTVTNALIVAVEKTAPHDVAVFELHADGGLRTGRELREELLERLLDCRTHNEWPGRFTQIEPLLLPAWADPDDDVDALITT
jgi:hypothetical protein